LLLSVQKLALGTVKVEGIFLKLPLTKISFLNYSLENVPKYQMHTIIGKDYVVIKSLTISGLSMKMYNHWIVLLVVLCAYMIGGYIDSMAY